MCAISKRRLGGGRFPDIVLMDINLGEASRSGVDLVQEHFSSSGTRVIYTTAFMGLVTDAYRTEHCYLLTKPIRQEQLELALKRAVGSIEGEGREVLSFSFGPSVKSIPCSTIAWLESSRHRVEIHSDSGVHCTYESLQSLASKLPACFVKTHKSYITNLRKVFELGRGELVMVDGSRVPVSRHYQRAVKEALMAELGMSAR